MIGKEFIALIVLMIVSASTLACKSRMELSNYPIDEIKPEYEQVIAEVVEIIESDSGWYSSTNQFRIKIIKTYQGMLKQGELVRVVALNEKDHAVCPVRAENKLKYIFMLHREPWGYGISRFDYLASSRSEYFKKFTEQLDLHYKH